MNWYKNAQKLMDWNRTFMELTEELGREPSSEEVQKRMLDESFTSLKEPVLNKEETYELV